MARSLPLAGRIPEPASRPSPALALSAKGFRPFFLLAALFAVGIVPLWLLVLLGVAAPAAYLDPTSWHAHEMIFGFTVAVIAGFLLTAVGNWTQRETAVGPPLLALAGLWLGGRLALAFAPALPRGLPAVVDLAFLPVLFVVLARPLLAARSRRNFVMLSIVAGLFAANLAMHGDALGILAPGTARRASGAGIDLVIIVVLVVAGRVIPMFTRNAIGATSIVLMPRLDVLTVVAMAALATADVLAPQTRGAAALAGLVGLLAAGRAVRWGSKHTVGHPLLWILHAGYVWIVVGLLLRSAAGFGAGIPAAIAMHALTVGAIGSLTLGMMARVSLGHTGRRLDLAPPMRWAFAAIVAAPVARVFVPLLAPAWSLGALVMSGALWTIAFVLFLVVYAPILTSPRVDGKAG